MKMEKLQSPSLKDLFVDQIQNAIISGQLKIGDRLPSEREFARQMQVSLTVVHSGLQELESRGFVHIVPRQGAYVSNFRKYGNADTLSALMDYSGGELGNDVTRSILEIRKMSQFFIVEMIIKNASDEDFVKLGKKLADLAESKTAQETADNIFAFWHEACYISGDTIVPLAVYAFRNPIATLWKRYCKLYGKEELIENTKVAYDLMVARDLEGSTRHAAKCVDRAISGDRSLYFDIK